MFYRTPTLDQSYPTYDSKFVAALQPIKAGEPIAYGSIGLRECPACNVPPDIVTGEAEVIGKIAKTEIVPGQFLVESMFVDVNTASTILVDNSEYEAWFIFA